MRLDVERLYFVGPLIGSNVCIDFVLTPAEPEVLVPSLQVSGRKITFDMLVMKLIVKTYQ